jgi:hypothetical protein
MKRTASTGPGNAHTVGPIQPSQWAIPWGEGGPFAKSHAWVDRVHSPPDPGDCSPLSAGVPITEWAGSRRPMWCRWFEGVLWSSSGSAHNDGISHIAQRSNPVADSASEVPKKVTIAHRGMVDHPGLEWMRCSIAGWLVWRRRLWIFKCEIMLWSQLRWRGSAAVHRRSWPCELQAGVACHARGDAVMTT